MCLTDDKLCQARLTKSTLLGPAVLFSFADERVIALREVKISRHAEVETVKQVIYDDEGDNDDGVLHISPWLLFMNT